ncbi:hypothetical protein [Methylobacterium oxalidis]|uniref:Uncharacterized protein n=1 Tax=Methylobacterium oxalidis TaxID=944322 RepID=A0A512IXH2_9HYPH|nr:hypothetical protein [Methylobacterium oxalidis]GEP02299.1 hypothetical protein MOX02_03370 [Methylobacterium oxalidis]GJE31193.1 hypothetical protein LDDCCGHA_1369 [Methylobacterium oxalidis]GLS67678.1 hypothetical protein GCM10007888_60630 [Methylobacterium oxalidis]
MFALRYVATAIRGVAPRVVLTVDPDRADDVRMLSNPGVAAGVLRQPGDLCVISVERDATVLITTIGEGADHPEAVTLQLDRLDQSAPSAGRSNSRLALAAPQASGGSAASDAGDRVIPLRIAGHVERKGDLFVSGGDWLGDPDSSARIEGFSVQWPRRPANVDLSYGCALLGLGRLPDVVAGEFVGTRMQARAINGVTFKLIGEDADAYALIVEAVFSDGSHFGPALAPVDLKGPTGREHLVGLRLQLSEVKVKAPRSSARVSASTRPEPAPRKPARIFRAPRSSASI